MLDCDSFLWPIEFGTCQAGCDARLGMEDVLQKVSDCEGFIQEFGDAHAENCEATELLRVQRLPLNDLRADLEA